MRAFEFITESVFETPAGPIIRAQTHSQIKTNVKKSQHGELRGIAFPGELWFADAGNMLHSQMFAYIKNKTSNIKDAVSIYIQIEEGSLIVLPAEYGSSRFQNIKTYPIIRRLKLIVDDYEEIQ